MGLVPCLGPCRIRKHPGLETVGVVASIAQLAATVYGISKTLYEVSDALSNAPSDIKDLARDLETFSQELNLFYKLLENKDSRYSDEVQRLMAKIIGDCATIYDKIDTILRKLRTGSVMARIKWLFKEKEIVKLLRLRARDLSGRTFGCYAGVETNKDEAVFIAATATHSAAQLARLRWRGFAKLQDTEPESSDFFEAEWDQSRQNSQTLYAAPEELPSDEHADVLAVHNLTSALATIPVDLLNKPLLGRAKVSQYVGLDVPWTSCPVCNRLEIKSLVQIVLSQIADIVSPIARYTVMESMYQQWPNMTLEKNYEGSLADLCVHILDT
ncbi:hypothetical protein V496_02914 [Pseudogymnoascus sp. VKM F-4515 (FW-2607)]|nr:hypothetical protein V496_02914 [Pseudogymnoascus sp. VKM F-4515 (FW-2607)]